MSIHTVHLTDDELKCVLKQAARKLEERVYDGKPVDILRSAIDKMQEALGTPASVTPPSPLEAFKTLVSSGLTADQGIALLHEVVVDESVSTKVRTTLSGMLRGAEDLAASDRIGEGVKNVTTTAGAEDDAKSIIEGADAAFTFTEDRPDGGSVELHINETAVAMMIILVNAIAEAPPNARVRDVIVEYDGPDGARMTADLAAHGLLVALKDFIVDSNTPGPSL